MSTPSLEAQETALNTQLKQLSLDQDVKEREIRKLEEKTTAFQEVDYAENIFYQESLSLQLDDRNTDFFQQSTEETRWLIREESERLEEKNDRLHKEKRALLDREEQCLCQRKQLFDRERSALIWD